MIYKDCDNKLAVVTILERMLALAGSDKRALIERQLRAMRAGIRGEREAAWLIDSWLKDATRVAVVHDLRLDPGGGPAAQIDHLLIQRARRFHVLDTKHFAQDLKITDEGEFLRWNEAAKSWEGVPSPLVQNERRVALLRRVLDAQGLGECSIASWVLVAPPARIERPRRFDTACVMRADLFIERTSKSLEEAPGLVSGLLRTGLHASIGDIARRLAALHSPSTVDYMARFGVAYQAQPAAVPAAAAAALALAPTDACRGEERAANETGEDAGTAAGGERETQEPGAAPAQEAPGSCACGAVLSIRHGRFGHYFACAGCGGRTPVRLGCGNAGHQERLRKDGARFYRECGACGSSSLYFSNPE